MADDNSALDALYSGTPRPKAEPAKRKGSGTHHKIAVPRREAFHLLSEALARFEVAHYPAADRAAQQLVDLLHRSMILQKHPWPHEPSALDKIAALKSGSATK
jgi:hypothetical protein